MMYRNDQLFILACLSIKKYYSGSLTVSKLQPSDILYIFANNDGSGVVDTSSSYFDTVVVSLAPSTQTTLVYGQTGKVQIIQQSLIGINGNTSDVDSSIVFPQN